MPLGLATQISFVTANYVARELGFTMTQGWQEGDAATNAWFSPLETYEQRLNGLFSEIKALGFDTIDLWTAHASGRWATDAHLEILTRLLVRNGLRVNSLAGGFGETPRELEATCRVAAAAGTRLLGGIARSLSTDRAGTLGVLRDQRLRLGIENHPEKHPLDLLRQIGDDTDVLGTTVDTGWYGTQAFDAARAIKMLGDHVLHVHLKDVLRPGEHQNCQWGMGVVPIWPCVRVLSQIGYEGALAVEHEPEQGDPSEPCREMRETLVRWLEG